MFWNLESCSQSQAFHMQSNLSRACTLYQLHHQVLTFQEAILLCLIIPGSGTRLLETALFSRDCWNFSNWSLLSLPTPPCPCKRNSKGSYPRFPLSPTLVLLHVAPHDMMYSCLLGTVNNKLFFFFFFNVLVFWPRGRWDLSSPTRYQTYTLCIKRWSLISWTTKTTQTIFLIAVID